MRNHSAGFVIRTTDQISEVLRGIRRVIRTTKIVALGNDHLVEFCGERGLRVDCQADHWRFHSEDGEWEELSNFKIGKSVFRAILARLATLCNECVPDGVSPYGGKCDLSFRDRARTICVTFVNSSEAQRFELTPSNGGGR